MISEWQLAGFVSVPIFIFFYLRKTENTIRGSWLFWFNFIDLISSYPGKVRKRGRKIRYGRHLDATILKIKKYVHEKTSDIP